MYTYCFICLLVEKIGQYLMKLWSDESWSFILYSGPPAASDALGAATGAQLLVVSDERMLGNATFSIAAAVSYTQRRRTSRQSEQFGRRVTPARTSSVLAHPQSHSAFIHTVHGAHSPVQFYPATAGRRGIAGRVVSCRVNASSFVHSRRVSSAPRSKLGSRLIVLCCLQPRRPCPRVRSHHTVTTADFIRIA